MKLKRIFIPILLIVVFLAGCSGPPQSAAMDTPEKAVSAYVAAVAAGDFNAALTLCPADTMMKNFKADEYAKSMVTSSKNESVDEIKSEFTQQTAVLAGSLLQGEITAPKAAQVLDAAWTAQFLKDNSSKLKDLQALRIDKPYKTGYNLEVDSDVYKEATKNNRLIWGTDAFTERIALLQHNGKTFMAGFTLLEYNGAWGIWYVTSAFAELPTSGGPQAMTQDEYLKHVKPSATASK
jgi:PBP1b-binding outer membrane lipoprotein LpoB